jgi:5-methylcytosine-specific restriction endonuclease McrA
MAYKDPLDSRKKLSRQRHYHKNRQRYIDTAKRNKVRMREYVRSLKEKPCTDCSVQYPYYVMHFDHLHSKEYDIATLVNYNNRGKIESEIAKCEVVCANCHAQRTHQRGIV